ncbi:hypothetical protein MTR67_030024 [Solanum verrucosum]|uniref:F-box domain-containing protein n=1 Tax=Solanum verrucosum TaxID=315347 RepID=A0AAF0TY56_SOLVR|nr:hypothetical protein MTR67_030024 [Solanum verrucosum]
MDVDVATDIFSRLPVRSLLRFKCVSKLWMTLISDPYFKMKHLNNTRNDENSQKIIVNQCYSYTDKVSLYCYSLSSIQQVEQVQKLDCPSNNKSLCHTLYCCCNGLVLMGIFYYPDKYLQLLLLNPSTRESILLSFPKILPKDNCTWGLGYDSTSDDYKILKIDDKSRSEILALKSGSWRLTNKHPIDVLPMLTSTDSLAFVHGAFHWLISSLTKYYVMSFSISDEVYRDIPLPEQMYSNFSKLCGRGVSILGGTLCAYSHCVSDWKDMFKFWVMKDYVNASWTELFTIQGLDLQSALPKYMFPDGKVLLSCRNLFGCSYVFRTSNGLFGLWPRSDVI